MMILTPTEARRDLARSPALRRAVRAGGHDPDELRGLSAERIRETLRLMPSLSVSISIGSVSTMSKGAAGYDPASDPDLFAWYREDGA